MYIAEVILNKKESENIYLLGIKVSKNILKKFEPGQFLKIRLNEKLDPLIPRPFSVHFIESNILYILYQVVGKGTKSLSKIKKGDCLEFWGPLGKPFPRLKDYILCAGGVGIAGFGYLLQKNKKDKKYLPRKIFYGAKTKNELVRLDFFKKFHIPIEISTDDGSKGYRGFITELLEKEIQKNPKTILACGPFEMLKKIAKIAEKFKVDAYLVMETFLACGTGFCKGCVVPLKKGGYLHLCIDGPTLLSEEINLNGIY